MVADVRLRNEVEQQIQEEDALNIERMVARGYKVEAPKLSAVDAASHLLNRMTFGCVGTEAQIVIQQAPVSPTPESNPTSPAHIASSSGVSPAHDNKFTVLDLFRGRDGEINSSMASSPMHTIILGRANSGKNYALNWLIGKMKSIRNWDHLYLITMKASYHSQSSDAMRKMASAEQCIFKEDIENLDKTMKDLMATCRMWGHKKERTLVVVDDMTPEINSGTLDLVNLATTGWHCLTDMFVLYHGNFVSGKSGRLLRGNFNYALCLHTSIIHSIATQDDWVDRDKSKEAKDSMQGIMDNDSHTGVFFELPVANDVSKFKRFQADTSLTPYRIGKREEFGFLVDTDDDVENETEEEPEFSQAF